MILQVTATSSSKAKPSRSTLEEDTPTVLNGTCGVLLVLLWHCTELQSETFIFLSAFLQLLQWIR